MLLIFVLLTLLSLTVTGLPTNTTDLVLGNGTVTSSKYSANPNPACFWGGTDMAQMPGECRCWGTYTGRGADRAWMIGAIDKACKIFANGPGAPVKNYGLGPGLDQGRSSFSYLNVDDKYSFKIAASLYVQHDFDNCMGPLPVSVEYCWDSLRAELDACNTGGENGKRGGYTKWGCLTFILDPDPDLHWPYPSWILN